MLRGSERRARSPPPVEAMSKASDPPVSARVSACVICKDEARNIEACLESLDWADELVVVDSGSTDGTVELARKHTPRVLHREWRGYGPQRLFAIERCSHDWVLCLDADERATPALRDAVRAAVAEPRGAAGFEIRRLTWHLGRWIRHGGWYPDWKLRLVRRGRARAAGVEPHVRLEVDGPVRRLDADLLHYSYADFAHQIRTVNAFSDVMAEEYLREGRRHPAWKALVRPPGKFLECYVWKRGFLDGFPGFAIAAASAFVVFARYVKQWERMRAKEDS